MLCHRDRASTQDQAPSGDGPLRSLRWPLLERDCICCDVRLSCICCDVRLSGGARTRRSARVWPAASFCPSCVWAGPCLLLEPEWCEISTVPPCHRATETPRVRQRPRGSTSSQERPQLFGRGGCRVPGFQFGALGRKELRAASKGGGGARSVGRGLRGAARGFCESSSGEGWLRLSVGLASCPGGGALSLKLIEFEVRKPS